MAVYTEVADDTLAAFLAHYDLGRALSFKGIAEGVENSNYFLKTERGEYILTLYEKRVRPDDLPFFLGLMDHLAARGIACPTPVHGKDGRALRKLCGKPAAMVSFLPGVSPRKATVKQCGPLGQALARMHMAGADFGIKRANALSVGGWRPIFDKCKERAHEVKKGLAEEVDEELGYLEAQWPKDLPTGVIHADLFPDNVFFLGNELSGLIDFYFACNDFFAYDIAVCLNAWCFEPDVSFNITKAHAMLAAYRRVRDFSKTELETLPLLARGAAMRFLLTRLHDWLHHPPGALVTPKNPLEYYRKLRFHQRVRNPGEYGLD